MSAKEEFPSPSAPLEIKKWSSIEKDLLPQLGEYCIKQNLYRRDNLFYDFTVHDLKEIARNRYDEKGKNQPEQLITAGYIFLDEAGGSGGMISLDIGRSCNLKCDFERNSQTGQIDCEPC